MSHHRYNQINDQSGWGDEDDIAHSDIQGAYSSSMLHSYGSISPSERRREFEVDDGSSSPSRKSSRGLFHNTRLEGTINLCTGFVVFIICPFLVYALIQISDMEHMWLFHGTGSSTAIFPKNAHHGKPIKLMLMGDQMISWPAQKYDLAGKIKALLPGMPLTVVTHAKEHERVADIRNDVELWLQMDAPDCIFAFIDSDVTEDENGDPLLSAFITKEQEAQFHFQQYTANIHSMLGRAALNTQHLALAGPGMMGDGPWLLPSRLRGKKALSAAYKDANQKYASKYANVEYVDVGAALQHTVPWWYPFGAGFVTVDGERVNRRGAYVVAEAIAEKLREWYWPSDGFGDNDDWDKFENILDKDIENNSKLQDALINREIIKDELYKPLSIDIKTDNKTPDGKKKIKTVDDLDQLQPANARDKESAGNVWVVEGTGKGGEDDDSQSERVDKEKGDRVVEDGKVHPVVANAPGTGENKPALSAGPDVAKLSATPVIGKPSAAGAVATPVTPVVGAVAAVAAASTSSTNPDGTWKTDGDAFSSSAPNVPEKKEKENKLKTIIKVDADGKVTALRRQLGLVAKQETTREGEKMSVLGYYERVLCWLRQKRERGLRGLMR